MKKKFIIILIFLSAIFLFSETIIPEGEVCGEWSIEGSPYLIEGEITIPDGETLNITAGVLVEFQGHYKLNVQGRLIAEGTENNMITFTINDNTGFNNINTSDGGWHGIRFNNTPTSNDSSRIVYCNIKYGKSNFLSSYREVLVTGLHTNCLQIHLLKCLVDKPVHQ